MTLNIILGMKSHSVTALGIMPRSITTLNIIIPVITAIGIFKSKALLGNLSYHLCSTDKKEGDIFT